MSICCGDASAPGRRALSRLRKGTRRHLSPRDRPVSWGSLGGACRRRRLGVTPALHEAVGVPGHSERSVLPESPVVLWSLCSPDEPSCSPARVAASGPDSGAPRALRPGGRANLVSAPHVPPQPCPATLPGDQSCTPQLGTPRSGLVFRSRTCGFLARCLPVLG